MTKTRLPAFSKLCFQRTAFLHHRHSEQLTAATIDTTVASTRNINNSLSLVCHFIIVALYAKRTQQRGGHGYHHLYNYFPNSNL